MLAQWYQELLDTVWAGRDYVPIAEREYSVLADLDLLRRYGVSFSTNHEGRVQFYAKAHACSDASHAEQRRFATYFYRASHGLSYLDFPHAIAAAIAMVRDFQLIRQEDLDVQEDHKELAGKA